MDATDAKLVVIRKGKIPDAEGTPVKDGIYSGERGEYIIPDNANVPEMKVLKNDSEDKIKIDSLSKKDKIVNLEKIDNQMRDMQNGKTKT